MNVESWKMVQYGSFGVYSGYALGVRERTFLENLQTITQTLIKKMYAHRLGKTRFV